jgi:hypothetical protein
VVEVIVHRRRSLRLTGAAIAAQLGLARATRARWLARKGLGHLARLDPPAPVSARAAGRAVHLDIKTLGRFAQPGHRVTGRRSGCRNRGKGWHFVHVAVDDGTRFA